MSRDSSLFTSSLHPSPEPFHGESGELKPCPHCGGNDIRFDKHPAPHWREENHVWSMCCYDCGATFPNRYRKELLVKAWNTRTPDPESAAEIERLRREKEQLLLSWNERCVEMSVNGHGWMEAHDQLLGFMQSRPELLAALTVSGPKIKYPSPADVPAILQRALTAESLLAAAWENAAKIAENYQPHGRMQHHGTRQGIAAALRAAGKEVSTKTAESGHSPSTREG